MRCVMEIMSKEAIQKLKEAGEKDGYLVTENKSHIIFEKFGYNPFMISKFSGNENSLKEKAQKGQTLLTEAILELFKSDPKQAWTAGQITEEFNLYKGYDTGEGGNDWLSQAFLRYLTNKKPAPIIHLGKPRGYKLNPEWVKS